jgi:hypothetical protein
MARLERLNLVQFRDYDDKRVEGLIELWAEHGVTAPIRSIRCYLIDRTVSDFPQYVLCDDEDMTIWPPCLTDDSVDLGKHRSEYVAIAVCQEHHDSIHGSSL